MTMQCESLKDRRNINSQSKMKQHSIQQTRLFSEFRLFPSRGACCSNSRLQDDAYFCEHILHITQSMVKPRACTRVDIEATYYATKYRTNCKHEPADVIMHTQNKCNLHKCFTRVPVKSKLQHCPPPPLGTPLGI